MYLHTQVVHKENNLLGFTLYYKKNNVGQDSDSLQGGRSEDRFPVEPRSSAPVQTVSEAHPASYTMGIGSLPGVKWPGCGNDHPPPSSVKVKQRVELYLYFPLGLHGLF